ncbi:MAG: hypothetical protein Q7S55_01945 [Nanoarchaeota archaeon]|nr:hypothetical protein [Nanoarchaeota archaeon]
MKKLLAFIALFLLSFSVVAAVDVSVSTNKLEYSSGQTVTATISNCIGTSIVEFRNPSGDLVDIKTGTGSWSTTYNTLSDTEDGKYKVEATCTNGEGYNNFCVDASGCLPAAPSSTNTTTGTTGSGGGTTCTPNWSCDEWSFCGPALTQTRSCTDLTDCQAEKEESRSCETCLESWVCSIWNTCSAASQTRICYDEHECGTTGSKPALQKGCSQADPFPAPARVSTKLPPPYVPPVAQQSFLSMLWDDYKLYIIGGLAAIVLVAAIILTIYFLVPKKVAYNINELKQWVRKEKETGTSDADIREILKQNTGWDDEEIDVAFESSKTPSRTVSNSSPA